MSGVALAMRYRQWFIHLRAQRPMKGTLPTLLRSMALHYVYILLTHALLKGVILSDLEHEVRD